MHYKTVKTLIYAEVYKTGEITQYAFRLYADNHISYSVFMQTVNRALKDKKKQQQFNLKK